MAAGLVHTERLIPGGSTGRLWAKTWEVEGAPPLQEDFDLPWLNHRVVVWPGRSPGIATGGLLAGAGRALLGLPNGTPSWDNATLNTFHPRNSERVRAKWS